MPLYEIEGPDKRIYTIEGPEGASIEQLVAVIKQQGLDLPTPQPKQSTIGGEFKRGIEQLVSSSVAGVGAVTGSPEEAALAGLRRGERIGEEAGEGPSLERLKRIFDEQGFVAASKALAGDVPRILAGQGANIAAAAGGAKLGAMAGTPLGPPGQLVGGGLGAFAALYPSVFGQMIERQAGAQQERGEPVAIDRGTAALAATGASALEAGGTAAAAGFQGGALNAQVETATKLAILGQVEQQQALELVLNRLKETKSNVEFLMMVQKSMPVASGSESE